MGVARNVVQDPKLLPGGGAVEMAITTALREKAATVEGVEQVGGNTPRIPYGTPAPHSF